ncbi:hypothetical protein R5R35_009741 [Gryllus longicercus]|uniref:Uncharacterized protein n=1 Tax=Gryllus longicercus TaxID=2509291 RepID=A0AAN9W0Y6_9ORTH
MTLEHTRTKGVLASTCSREFTGFSICAGFSRGARELSFLLRCTIEFVILNLV